MNSCELYSPSGAISTSYTYTPFGKVTASGNVTQPIQWSSEVWDGELGLVYYNWRYYNAWSGRWLVRDFVWANNSYLFSGSVLRYDFLGLEENKQDGDGLAMYKNYLSNKSLFIEKPPGKDKYYETFLYYDPKIKEKIDLLYIHPDAIKAIDEIRDYVANFNATNIDKYGRKCRQIHIYPHVVSMQGISKLPWLGYEKAVILGHSEYVNEEVSYLDTGISTGRYEPNLKVPIGSQPNVEVFGCHLSKLVGGKLLFYDDIVPMLKTYFNSYKSDNCCDSTRYIQLLTTPRNGKSYVPLDE